MHANEVSIVGRCRFITLAAESSSSDFSPFGRKGSDGIGVGYLDKCCSGSMWAMVGIALNVDQDSVAFRQRVFFAKCRALKAEFAVVV